MGPGVNPALPPMYPLEDLGQESVYLGAFICSPSKWADGACSQTPSKPSVATFECGKLPFLFTHHDLSVTERW